MMHHRGIPNGFVVNLHPRGFHFSAPEPLNDNLRIDLAQ